MMTNNPYPPYTKEHDDFEARRRKQLQAEYDAAPRCPVCGTKQGFAWGTGDCGCEVDRD